MKPFQARSRSKKIEAIRRGDYTFDAPRWQHVSKEAIDFVSSLLICDPQKRPTAEVAVQHPWLKLEKYPNRESEVAHESLRGVSEHILTYARTNELKRIACSVIAHKSSEEEITDLRKAFDRFDYKKDGVISLEEFRRALSNLNYTAQEINDMFRQMDVNKNGVRRAVIRILLSLLIRKDSNSNCIQVILYTEFLAATLEMRGVIEEKRLAEAFDHIDDDDSGYISKENLMQLLGENVTGNHIERLIEEVDRDGDGRISFEEFFSMFRQNNAQKQQSASSKSLKE
ncbi:hypothetical protein THAOC_17678 [Thalassiosira oceanica]|uniref:Uncharacterized protein n=1 Tax=Thalassiosira oceanica TaxID=159749 RepID=K0SA29_THAOC|nr:hypothetical protein THAOC_17678 [Thalassiosira oceanica]|eukprot:EJK61779.1 hypothetical protein THAOC_17678 [Thalassiosira oceanica]